jgi:hypothetical protein
MSSKSLRDPQGRLFGINRDKSTIFFLNVSLGLKRKILKMMGFKKKILFLPFPGVFP